jgi:hypothetical protein
MTEQELFDLELVARYLGGDNMQQIADKVGLSRQRVSQRLQRNGINGHQQFERRLNLGIGFYVQGQGLTAAARAARTSVPLLREALKAKGLMRKRVPLHGRVSEYLAHNCRCQPCKSAWAAYKKMRYHLEHPEARYNTAQG